MARIVKEIPSGTIDSSNKTFLLANVPDYVDTVWMDGTLYLSFSVV